MPTLAACRAFPSGSDGHGAVSGSLPKCRLCSGALSGRSGPQRRGRGAGEFQAQQPGHCCFWGLVICDLDPLAAQLSSQSGLRLNLDRGLFLHCRVSGTQPVLPSFLIVNSFFFFCSLAFFFQGFFRITVY